MPLKLTWETLLLSCGVFFGAIIVKQILSYFIEKLGRKTKLRKSESEQVKRFISYFIYGGALLVILSILGVDPTLIATSLGVLGIAISFAAKDILANLFSGMFLFIERTYKINDIVKIGETVGKIKLIKLRSTQIETFDGNVVTIPNSKIASSEVINMTSGSQIMLSSILVKVGYKENIDKIKELMINAAKEIEGTYIDEGHEVKFLSESLPLRYQGIDLKMYFYVKANKEPWIRSRVQEEAIKEVAEYRKSLGRDAIVQLY